MCLLAPKGVGGWVREHCVDIIFPKLHTYMHPLVHEIEDSACLYYVVYVMLHLHLVFPLFFCIHMNEDFHLLTLFNCTFFSVFYGTTIYGRPSKFLVI